MISCPQSVLSRSCYSFFDKYCGFVFLFDVRPKLMHGSMWCKALFDVWWLIACMAQCGAWANVTWFQFDVWWPFCTKLWCVGPHHYWWPMWCMAKCDVWPNMVHGDIFVFKHWSVGHYDLPSFFKNLVDTCPFLRPLIPLYWTSGDVSSGFQSKIRQPFLHLAEAYVIYILWDSPLV